MIARVHKSILAGLAASLGVLALGAGPAGAATGYAPLCATLQTAFCGSGTVSYGGLGVDQSSGSSAGDVWLAKGGEPHKLAEFDASGNQLAEIGEGLIVENGPVAAGRVAVDPTSGSVYVSEYGEGETVKRVTKFSSSGALQLRVTGSETPQGSFLPGALAVDYSGNLYVMDGRGGVVDEFTSSGKYLGQFSVPRNSGEYRSLAADPQGNIYVGVSGSQSRVLEYSSTGAPVNCPNGSNAIYEETAEEARSRAEKHYLPGQMQLAVDPSDEHIFISEVNAGEGIIVAEYGAPCTAPLTRVRLSTSVEGEISGISVNSSTHDLYVVPLYPQGPTGIFGPVTIPDVATGASATSITRTSAVVSGTVNPDGTSVTSCEFEYGTTVAYGHTAPCSQSLPLTGAGDVPVSAQITLSVPPASLVHYRLKAANSNGTNVGEDQTFYLESLPPPTVGGLPASNVSQFAATLNGTLQTGEALVNYRFEYGTTTAYGQVAPIPDSYTPITSETLTVSQPIQSLQAGTTYHYRLLASSPGGTEVAGPDETFTTLPVPVPTVSTGGASDVGVGSATLSGTIDPHGWDTTYLFQYGTSTAYGQSWPTVSVDMGALEGAQPVVVNVPNLLPNTTYHYRLVAINGGGTGYGQDMTFTTGEYPARVIGEPPALGTLLVPSEPGKVTTSEPKKKTRKKGKGKPKRRRARHAARKSGRARRVR